MRDIFDKNIRFFRQDVERIRAGLWQSQLRGGRRASPTTVEYLERSFLYHFAVGL